MRIAIALLVAAAALCLLPPVAAADNGRPTVHKRTAEERTRSFLWKKFPSWRYRAFGFIDCRRGRINRYTWVCRVGWGRGRTCHRGRVRVTGAYREPRFNVFNVQFGGRRGYRCVGTG